MSILSVLGAIGTVIGLVRAMPQFVRLATTKDVHGVSLDAVATSSVVSAAWTTYGVMTGQIAVALASGLSCLVFALISFLAVRYGRWLGELRSAPVAFVVFLAVVSLMGVTGLGVILMVGALVANTPQVIAAYREPNLSGISPSTWRLTASDGATWMTYGAIAGDLPIFINNAFQFATAIAVLVRRAGWAVRQKRLGLASAGGRTEIQDAQAR